MIPQLALRLIFGMASLWLVLPRRDISTVCFQHQMALAFVASLIAMATMGQIPIGPAVTPEMMKNTMFGAAGWLAQLSLIAVICIYLNHPRYGAYLGYAIVFVAAIAVIFPTLGMSRQRIVLARLCWDAVSSGLLLGMVTAATLIGLDTLKTEQPAARMKFDPFPLLKCSFLLGIAVVLRSLIMLMTLPNMPTDIVGFPVLLSIKIAGLLGTLVLSMAAFRNLRRQQLRAGLGCIAGACVLTWAAEISSSQLFPVHANQLGL